MSQSKPKLILAYNNPAGSVIPGKTILTWQTTTRKPRYGLWTDLLPEELVAIGLVTMQWAHLEHLILLRSKEMADGVSVTLPKDAESLSFAVRLRAWLFLVRETIKDQAKQKKLLSIHGKITQLENKRHKITHGLWSFEMADPLKLTALSTRSPHIFHEPFDVESLHKLAEEISEVNFSLHFPDGPDSLEPPSSYVSRSYLLMLSEKDPYTDLDHLTIDQEQSPRQSSSEE
jgi:hypothetical protein